MRDNKCYHWGGPVFSWCLMLVARKQYLCCRNSTCPGKTSQIKLAHGSPDRTKIRNSNWSESRGPLIPKHVISQRPLYLKRNSQHRFQGLAQDSIESHYLCKMNRKREGIHWASNRTSTKAPLLPPTLESVRSLSLRNHLALAALCAGEGNGHLLSDLLHVLYMSCYLREAGFGTADGALFRDAAAALERSAARATTSDVVVVPT